MCMSFPGAPGIISPPYAGAGFPPTFAIPQATGTVFHKLIFYVGFLLLKHLHLLKRSSAIFVWVSHVNSKCWHLNMEGTGVPGHQLSWECCVQLQHLWATSW